MVEHLLASNPKANLVITTALYFITTFSLELNMASCRTLRKQNTPRMATPTAATSPATHTATVTKRKCYRANPADE